MEPDDVFGLEPSLEEGLEKLWPKVGGGSAGTPSWSRLETCCWRSCRLGWPGSRKWPDGPRGWAGGAFWSLPGPGDTDREDSGGEDWREAAGEEACLGILGRSERSGREKREDSLFAAMMMCLRAAESGSLG
jgi:hypothetical protein